MKRRQLTDARGGLGRGTIAHLETLADRIQAEDRQRLLEPTALPKELRGFKRRPPPNTALLTKIAFEAFKARMWADGKNLSDQEARRLFLGTSL